MMQTVKQVSLGLIAALSLLALFAIAEEGQEKSVHATSLEVGVDVTGGSINGNGPTTVGTVDTCRTVSLFSSFDIDFYFQNGISNLVAADMWFQYDPSILEIQSYTVTGLFQDDGSFSSIEDASEPLHNGEIDGFETGAFQIGAVDTGEAQGDTGLEGVLFRVNVRAIGTGLSPAKISKMDLNNDGTPDRGITLANSSQPVGYIGDVDGDSFYDGTIVNSAVFVGSGACGADSDSDGITDELDNCLSTANPGQEDWNNDGTGDACQDFDGDGVGDDADNCPGDANTSQEDQDSDGVGDACDSDVDNDGVDNEIDNCPDVVNASQSDMDSDGLGDACDSDMDGDHWPNTSETAITTNPSSKCGASAFPPDFDDDANITILDVLSLKPVFLSSAGDGTYVVRKDISPQLAGPDGAINILDVLAIKPYFLKNCNTDL